MKKRCYAWAIIASVLVGESLWGAGEGEIAKKLTNPVEAMISAPIQVNYQPNIGPSGDGHQWLTNVQPVIPIDINEQWNLISRTIIPLVSRDLGVTGVGIFSGVGDILQSAWFSPKSLTDNGWIWGAGAAFLIPTGSEVSAKKWAVGPTALGLKQDGAWTYGGLFNHLWSYAGSDTVTSNVNQTFIQPFVSYVTPQAVTFSMNAEITYDWEHTQWTLPINCAITKVTKIGGQMISYGAGISYWATSPDGGPEGWGARFILTFIFPK